MEIKKEQITYETNGGITVLPAAEIPPDPVPETVTVTKVNWKAIMLEESLRAIASAAAGMVAAYFTAKYILGTKSYKPK